MSYEPFAFENQHARMEIRSDFAYVRKIDQDGCGGRVIEASLKPRQRASFQAAVENAIQADRAISFSKLWDLAICVKGASFTHRSF